MFQHWGAGQPVFITMNQRGDKISPVTKQGYEIRVLIEFSGPGRVCGALNIIELDRLMKSGPVLVLPLSTGPRESAPPLPHANMRMLMFPIYVYQTSQRESRFFESINSQCVL